LPGEYITDTQIADRLEISRTPVREAFLRLENENLLIYEARRGWKVYALSLEDIQEIFDLKEAIEGMVAWKAAACEDEELRVALQGAIQAMYEAARTGDTETWVQADHEFHDIMFKMAGNERARRIIYNLNDQWNRVLVGFRTIQGRIERSCDEHKAIMESVLSGDGEKAKRQVDAHFKELRRELIHLLVNMVLPFAKDGV
jgi:DNA-binding GntR family transcriptional regulator